MVGGFEPDDNDQRVLVELWHLSRTALSGKPDGRSERIAWVVDAFMKDHGTEPNVGRKWIYVWAVDNLGVMQPISVRPSVARARVPMPDMSWLGPPPRAPTCCTFHALNGLPERTCSEEDPHTRADRDLQNPKSRS